MNKYNTPLQNMKEYCSKCNVPKDYKNSVISIGEAREACIQCKAFGRNGIYKFDIAYSLFKTVKKNNLTAGKKPVYEKRYGDIVVKLRKEGKTMQEIAELIGISRPTVKKILENKEKNNK